MNELLRQRMARFGGVATRAELLTDLPRQMLDAALREGALHRVFPRVYACPEQLAHPWGRAAAALRYGGPGSALSHTTGLALWQLPGGERGDPIHLVVPQDRRLRAGAGLVVHRRKALVAEAPEVLARNGLAVCRLERCVVDSWALLPADTRRAAVIAAVGDRRTTCDRLLNTLDKVANLRGRAELVRLVHLLARGCRSELELWGYEKVFIGEDLPPFERDVPVRVGERTVYLDLYCRMARLNIELDGAKYHSSVQDRERDVRRDAALAALGILVVRFTHDQLVRHPAHVCAQVRAIVAARLARH